MNRYVLAAAVGIGVGLGATFLILALCDGRQEFSW